jgi:hypothetical protein
LGDSTAEGGSNAGSNFALYSYTDAGTSLGTPLTIARADGGVTLTGVLTLPNGTAALPSLTFTGGTTTGLYYSASALNLTVGGTTRLQATGSGNISTVVHKGVDGVVGGPGYSFNSEASSGLYRKAAGSVSVSGANSEVMNWLGSTKTTTAFGPVLLAADPTVALQAATRQYVDTQITTRISVVKTLLITASGTYTPSAGMVYCTVEVVGGGGAGGGVPATAAGQFAVGSGGSGGSYSRSTLTAAQVGPSQTVTVGAGGTGVSAATGNNGVASSFGALVTAPGGLGGAAGTASASSGTNVTQPGAAGTGTIAIRGFAGSGGFSSYPNFAPAGIGGGSGAGKGSGGATGNLAGVGASGGNYGGGGGGASINASIAAQLGGAGGPGAIIITEYCTQ